MELRNEYLGYEVKAHWTGNRSGMVHADLVPDSIAFTAPPEFKGHPGHWTPEHFLIAAVAGCFLTTFRAIAEFSKFELLSFTLEARGTIEKQRGGLAVH